MDIEKQRCRTDAAAVDVEVEQGHAARLEVDSRPRPGLSPAVKERRMADDAHDISCFPTQNLVVYGD